MAVVGDTWDWRGTLESFRAAADASPIQVRDMIRIGETLLRRSDVWCGNSHGSPRADARAAVFHVLAILDHDDGYLDAVVTRTEVDEILALLERRVAERIPMPYLTGEAFFGGLRFHVRPGVFVPRGNLPKVLPRILSVLDRGGDRALDLGAGCGALGILVAGVRGSLHVDLADISPIAVEASATNVRRFGLTDRVCCVKSDLFGEVPGPYDLIVSNPPYVASGRRTALRPEVRHEPDVAFFSGEDGLTLVDRILREAPDHLTPRGTLVLEVGPEHQRTLPRRHPDLDLRWWDDGDRPLGVCTLSMAA